jgi:hypothetical protein
MSDDDKNAFRDFVRFLNTKPVDPNPRVDDAILQVVKKDLCIPVWQIYAKMLLISVSSGMMSLMVCPQFGIGQETLFFHSLHATSSDIVPHLLCGLFFVTIGASLNAALLKRSEIQAISKQKYTFFIGYSFICFTLFITFGKDAFVVSSLFWVLGAILGNVLGFLSINTLRFALK